MARYTKVKAHLTLEEIEKKIKETVGFWRIRRWMIIMQCMVEPTTTNEVAKRCGVKKQTVANLIASYNKHGEAAVETEGKGQRQRAYMTTEEEDSFLKEFLEEADKGILSTANDIHRALEEYLHHKVSKSTVYRMLKRHGWRKIMPRPAHPKANKEEQETFKKTLPKK